jgi:tetratricopeptide (TPR) repeat protein
MANCFKYTFFVLLAAANPLLLRAGSSDSLLHVLRSAKADTHKVSVLLDLGLRLRATQTDSALLFAEDAERLSVSLHFTPGQAKSYHLIGLCYYIKGNADSALSFYARALDIWKKMEADGSAGWQLNMSKTICNIGSVRLALGDYNAASDYYLQALELARAAKDENEIARNLGNLGVVFYNKGDYPRALENYLEALKIKEKLGNKPEIAVTLGNIGIVYFSQGDYPKALEFYNKGLKLDEELGNTYNMAAWLGNIGSVYFSQKEYDKAFEHYSRALELAKSIGSDKLMADNLGNIGAVYSSKKRYTDALDYFIRALKEGEKVGDKTLIGTNLGNIGTAYFMIGDNSRAEDYLLRAIQLVRTIGALSYVMEFEGTLSDLYERTGKYQLSFEHYKKHIAAKDSLVNEENTRKTVQASMLYEFEKKQAADSIRKAEQLKQEQFRHDQEIRQQRIYTYGGVIGFLLMVIVAGVSFNAYRQKQKANAIITEQKSLVEEKQKEILDSIYYARRIQRSLLPSEKYIQRVLERLRS